MDKIAIVILNYNGRHFLEMFLPTLQKFSYNYPIYVADNHSDDASIDLIKNNFPEVNVIILDKNYGFSKGYNKALSLIEAEYFVLLNSDIEVSENWLIPMLDLMESNPVIGACQPKILDYKRKEYFEYAGAAGGYIDLLGYPFCRGRLFNTIEKDFGQYNDKARVFWATGACLMIRSQLYDKSGGFDDDYFAHMEEIDLCWRINRMGHEVWYVSDSEVYHVGGGTLDESNPFKTYLNFRNSLITIIKNDRIGGLLWKIPVRIVLDILAGIKFLFSNSYKDSAAVFKADLDVLFSIRKHLKKRMHSHFGKKGNNWIYSRSLVFSYFFLRKRYFFNLRSIIPNRIISPAQPFSKIHSKSQS